MIHISISIAAVFMNQNDTPSGFVHKMFPDLSHNGAAFYTGELMKQIPPTYDHNAAVRERQQQHPELIQICEGVYFIILLSLYYYLYITIIGQP